MDMIRIKDLRVFAHHGVLPKENEEGQNFYVSCDIFMDLEKAGRTDDLEESVNYGEVCHLIKKVMQESQYKLIETCAEAVSRAILLMDERIKEVTVEIKKPSAPIGLPLKYPSVRITRGRHLVYIALGSNLGDSRRLVEEAAKKINDLEDTWVKKGSDLIVTRPYGVTDQPDFINGVLSAITLKSPYQLLDALHNIEAQAGRERTVHWGPRTLDLDIIFYDDLIMEEDDLCIPHADMHNRDFVLEPMVQIAPYKMHPVLKKRIIELYKDRHPELD